MFLRLSLLLSILFSLAIHLVLFLTLPGISLPDIPEKEYTEVELISRPIPLPPPPPEPKEVKEIQAAAPKAEKPPEPKEPFVEPTIDEPNVATFKRVSELSMGLTFKNPALDLTTPKTAAELEETIKVERPEPSFTAPDILGKLEKIRVAPGYIEGEEIPVSLGELTKEEMKVPEYAGATDLLKEEPPVGEGLSQNLSALQMPEELMRIKGPASERKVVFRPPAPPFEVKAEATIELKFWVLPDGSVEQVVPLRIDDPTLVAEAIKYLKEWRFNPLSPQEPQEKQWGIIPFVFRFD